MLEKISGFVIERLLGCDHFALLYPYVRNRFRDLFDKHVLYFEVVGHHF